MWNKLPLSGEGTQESDNRMPPAVDAPRPLSDHLAEYLKREKTSLRALEDRCVDPETGNHLNRTWVSSLAAGKVRKWPEMWRLRALSAGIGTPAETLRRLAAEQWLQVSPEVAQVPVGDDDWVILPVRVSASLDEAGRAKVIRWAEQWARELDSGD